MRLEQKTWLQKDQAFCQKNEITRDCKIANATDQVIEFSDRNDAAILSDGQPWPLTAFLF